MTTAEEQFRRGDLTNALRSLQSEVRDDPSDPRKRVFLFQLLSILGDWSRAENQLEVLGGLDESQLMFSAAYRVALEAEAERERVFDAQSRPTFWGEKADWYRGLIDALNDDASAASQRRTTAFESAPTASGTINGEAFAWIADSDSRLGPILEVVVNGRLQWVPFDQVVRIEADPPSDLRDTLWLPARFTWANGSQDAGLIPARYVGSPHSPDPQIQLGRKTTFEPIGADYVRGLGQRILSTDQGDYPILEVREIQIYHGE